MGKIYFRDRFSISEIICISIIFLIILFAISASFIWVVIKPTILAVIICLMWTGFLWIILRIELRKTSIDTKGNILIPGYMKIKSGDNIYFYCRADYYNPTSYNYGYRFNKDNVKEAFITDYEKASICPKFETSYLSKTKKAVCIIFKEPLKFEPSLNKSLVKISGVTPPSKIEKIYVSMIEPEKFIRTILS